MDFHELRAFVLLARHLHFARAAALSHLSPSALSRLVSRLEEEMGTRLVDRDQRTVALTEAGQRFLAFAQESLDRYEALHLQPGHREGELRGSLRVFASVTACYSILPPLADLLHQNHPDLKLQVTTGDPADAEGVLKEGKVDLALSALEDRPPQGLTAWPVGRTPLVFAASRGGPFAELPLSNLPLDRERARRIWIQELKEVPLILPSRGLARDRLDRWCRIQGVHPRIAAETSGNEAVLALARLGLGLGLVPRIVLENSPFSEGLVLFPAGEELGDYELGFLYPERPVGDGRQIQKALTGLLQAAYPRG